MRSRASPIYANIFIGAYEVFCMFFYSDTSSLPSVYRWGFSHMKKWSEIILTTHYLKSCQYTIKFTWNYSARIIHFLAAIVKKYDHRLIPDTYRKPTEKRRLLCYDSCHPKQQKNYIHCGRFPHLRRIFFEDFDFERNKFPFKHYPVKRKYTLPILDHTIWQAFVTI